MPDQNAVVEFYVRPTESKSQDMKLLNLHFQQTSQVIIILKENLRATGIRKTEMSYGNWGNINKYTGVT